MKIEKIPVFERETALRIFLEELQVPAESRSFPLLCCVILSRAEDADKPLQSLLEETAAAFRMHPDQVYRGIRHLILTAWANDGIAERMSTEQFITYAAAWLLDAETAFRK